MCPSSVVHHLLSVIHHPSKWGSCLHVSASTMHFLGVYKVVCTCCVILTALSMPDMAWLSKLLQLEQEHVGWWQSFSRFGGWYTEEEATAQAVGPSYNRKRKRHGTYYHLVKDDLMKYGEKFHGYLRLTREQFDQAHRLFVLLGAVYTGESPEYWLRILGICIRQLSFDKLNRYMEWFGDDRWWVMEA